jgi:hypothetical protein
MNLAESLRRIKSFEAKRAVIKSNIDLQLATMQDPGTENEIRAAWQGENGITDRTKNAIRFGVSHALAASTREELFAKLPGNLLLDPSVTRRGKHMEEVVANHNLQQELNSHKNTDATLLTGERSRIASLISQLYFTANGQEGNSTGSLRDRLKFIGVVAQVITGFILKEHKNLIYVNDPPPPSNPDKPSPDSQEDILIKLNNILGDN